MSEPFLAEVRIVGFNFPPRGWAFCDGQILPINQHQSLYSLLGTTYGGDGRTSFALPDLRGRTPIHIGSNGTGGSHTLGSKSGEEAHPLTANEIPQHTHPLQGSTVNASQQSPSGNVFARGAITAYHDRTSPVNMHSGAVGNIGTGAGHENMQPYLALNFCIALTGVFPSRN